MENQLSQILRQLQQMEKYQVEYFLEIIWKL